MALLFGRFAQNFVNFQMVLGGAQAGNASAAAMIPEAAAILRHDAAQNAVYFVILGS
jgi:ATP-binding cassette subfamily B (MDR/TAP) protein 1